MIAIRMNQIIIMKTSEYNVYCSILYMYILQLIRAFVVLHEAAGIIIAHDVT